MQTTQQRIQELEREILERQQQIQVLRWVLNTTGTPATWFKSAMICTMPQGHPSHCGCEWN
jgi:hypothetical protein